MHLLRFTIPEHRQRSDYIKNMYTYTHNFSASFSKPNVYDYSCLHLVLFSWVVISPLDHLTSLKAHDCFCFPLAFHLFTLLISFRKNNHWLIFKFPDTSLTLQRISDVHALFKSAEMLSSELLLIIKLLFTTSHVRTIGFYKINWRDVTKMV